ncbi:MAG TPA: hypothetical protein VLL52_16315, partial [Anaerolineae bacterium]|nr:hypothetical protein [Anaerolineae bacterium]
GTVFIGLILIVGAGLGLNELYFSGNYGKDDIRQLVDYVEARAGQADIVVYSDAILMQLHYFYSQRPALPVTALPVYPHYYRAETGETLNDYLATYERIWHVPSLAAEPGERDAERMVRETLLAEGRLVEKVSWSARGTALGVELYDTRPVAVVLDEDEMGAVRWDGFPALVGHQILSGEAAREAAREAVWVDLYWGDERVETEQLQLRWRLRAGGDDWSWVEESRPLGERPEAVGDGIGWRRSYGVTLPVGTPPGRYELSVVGWFEDSGTLAGEWLVLGEVMVGISERPLFGRGRAAEGITFANGYELVKVAARDEAVKPGHVMPVDLVWRAGEGGGDLRYRVEIVGEDGAVLGVEEGGVGPGWLAAEAWPVEQGVGDRLALYFPPTAEPGTYRLRWQLFAGDELIQGRRGWGWAQEAVVFGGVEVEPWPLVTTLPAVGQEVGAIFGEGVRLHGYDLEIGAAGGALRLVWVVERPFVEDYYAFVHLVDSEGKIVTQIDWTPVTGLRPTSGWRAGEVLVDEYWLGVADSEGADYEIVVGLYRPADGWRVPVVVDGEVMGEGGVRLPWAER